jgi:hypothetical protein
LGRKLEGRRPLGRFSIYWRIILEWILSTGLIWLRTGASDGIF